MVCYFLKPMNMLSAIFTVLPPLYHFCENWNKEIELGLQVLAALQNLLDLNMKLANERPILLYSLPECVEKNRLYFAPKWFEWFDLFSLCAVHSVIMSSLFVFNNITVDTNVLVVSVLVPMLNFKFGVNGLEDQWKFHKKKYDGKN